MRDGYLKISHRMGHRGPERVISKFGKLNTRNIMYTEVIFDILLVSIQLIDDVTLYSFIGNISFDHIAL